MSIYVYSNGRHTQIIRTGSEKVITLENPVQILKKISRILIPDKS